MSGEPAPEEKPKHVIINEGKASIVFPNENTVFYNPVQVFNRDLSILAIRIFLQRRKAEMEAKHNKKMDKIKARLAKVASGELKGDVVLPEVTEFECPGADIFEALSASGLRSIRYWKEIPDLKQIIVNDLSADAVETIKKNIAHNECPAQVVPSHGDANLVMMKAASEAKLFDVVDLDPYGSANIFTDAAVQCVAEGGLLAVTCTDKAVLCGNNCEASYAKYGSMPLRGGFCHDQAVRMVLNMIDRSAAKYKRYIVPMLSMSIDFYVRVFVRVYTSAAEVKKTSSKQAMVYQCNQCGNFALTSVGEIREHGNSIKYSPGYGPPLDQKCAQCGGRHKVGGPIWGKNLHDKSFISAMLAHAEANKDDFATFGRIKGNLKVCGEELEVPLMIDIPSMCRVLKATTPPTVAIRSALINAGYKVSQTHTAAIGIKTDAPLHVVWDVLRCWVRENPLAKKSVAGSAAEKILAVEPTLQADFTKAEGAETAANKTGGVAKFIKNPANWGPGARAKPGKRKGNMHDQLQAKSRENQGKNKKKKLAAKEAKEAQAKASEEAKEE